MFDLAKERRRINARYRRDKKIIKAIRDEAERIMRMIEAEEKTVTKLD